MVTRRAGKGLLVVSDLDGTLLDTETYGFEGARVAFHVITVAELLVEIDQVHKNESVRLALDGLHSLLHAIGIVFGL